MYKNEDKAFLKFPEYITPVSVIEHDVLAAGGAAAAQDAEQKRAVERGARAQTDAGPRTNPPGGTTACLA